LTFVGAAVREKVHHIINEELKKVKVTALLEGHDSPEKKVLKMSGLAGLLQEDPEDEVQVQAGIADELVEDEFNRYLQSPAVKDMNSSPLDWWKQHQMSYPRVGIIADDTWAFKLHQPALRDYFLHLDMCMKRRECDSLLLMHTGPNIYVCITMKID